MPAWCLFSERKTFTHPPRHQHLIPVPICSTSNASMASLFADDFCGAGTILFYYIMPSSVLSRTVTPKDTHSPVRDLLAEHRNAPSCYSESALTRQTNKILWFEVPTFTCGTNLILPIEANADLRDILASHNEMPTGHKVERDQRHICHISDAGGDAYAKKTLRA